MSQFNLLCYNCLIHSNFALTEFFRDQDCSDRTVHIVDRWTTRIRPLDQRMCSNIQKKKFHRTEKFLLWYVCSFEPRLLLPFDNVAPVVLFYCLIQWPTSQMACMIVKKTHKGRWWYSSSCLITQIVISHDLIGLDRDALHPAEM